MTQDRSGGSSRGGQPLSAGAAAWLPEDDVLLAARERAEELGAPAVDPDTGAALRLLAAVVGARSVVEVGGAAGVSSVWLLRGMVERSVLTCIDADTEHQRAARQTFAEAGIAPARTRLISGSALEVLPRLADGGYDLVLLHSHRSEDLPAIEELLRVLRPGGLLLLAGATNRNRVADPSARDAVTVALRRLGADVREHPDLICALLPLAGGLLGAVRVSGQEGPA